MEAVHSRTARAAFLYNGISGQHEATKRMIQKTHLLSQPQVSLFCRR
jgi:hypothetical protein